jgi:hypothetical protein
MMTMMIRTILPMITKNSEDHDDDGDDYLRDAGGLTALTWKRRIKMMMRRLVMMMMMMIMMMMIMMMMIMMIMIMMVMGS